MKIKAILSDLGNVVVPFDNSKTFKGLARLSGHSPDKVESIFMATSEPLLNEYELGTLDDETFHQMVSSRLGLSKNDLPRGYFRRIYSDVFGRNQVVIDAWERCKRAGLPLVAVSNICPMRHRELMKMGVLDMFDHVVASYKERLRKPSEELMVRALDRASVRAEDALFVDDIELNLKPARKLGMWAHHFTDNERFQAFMKHIGVP